MIEPKVVLKNIKTFQGMEGYGLNADIWINGVKCLFVIDDACGGEFMYYENTEHKNPELVKKNIKLLDEYIDTLPEEKSRFGGTYKLNRDCYINNVLLEQVNKKAKEKHRKKMVKLFETAIVFGKPNDDNYRYWKSKIPLSKIPKSILQTYVNQLAITHCHKGITILNDNLTELGITHNVLMQ